MNYLKLIVILSVLPFLASCSSLAMLAAAPAELVESLMIDEACMSDEELTAPLKINIAPYPINHNLVVKEDGSLWSINTDRFRNYLAAIPKEIYLGRKTNDTFGQVPYLHNVKMTVTTVNSHLVLKKDGTVWSWGASGTAVGGNIYESTLGYEANDFVYQPQKIEGLPAIDYISYVDGSIMAVAANGSVWSWGLKYWKSVRSKNALVSSKTNDYFKSVNEEVVKLDREKRLSISSNMSWSNLSELRAENSTYPVRIPELKNIVKADKGIYLNKYGEVLVTMPANGQEVYIAKKISDYIHQIKLPNKVVDISGGYALLENGHVWDLGRSGLVNRKYSCCAYKKPHRIKSL